MLKRIFMVLCLCLFAAAGFVYVRQAAEQEDVSIDADLKQDSAIQVNGLLIYSYDDIRLTSRSIAGIANYHAPGRVELDGRISLVRYLENDRTDSAFADKAMVFLEGSDITDISEGSEIKKVELIENVVIKVNDHVLRTPYAEYFPLTQEIKTDWSVEISGPGRVFEGDSGLRYKVDTQELDVFGIVSGREINALNFK